MARFARRLGTRSNLEAELRATRPEPRPEFLAQLVDRVNAEPWARSRGARRLAAACVPAVALAIALASVGGLGYAASAAVRTAKTVERALTPSRAGGPVRVDGLNAGGDQYKPGYNWKDPFRNHPGAAGLTLAGGAFAPPLRAVSSAGGTARVVSTRIKIDEQAHLDISVLAPSGKRITLVQKGSSVGQGISGPPTKDIRYTVLIPRTLPLTLRFPTRLLTPGQLYRIRIVATDPDGNRSVLVVPFRA
jgi:hypothetical protein